MIEEPNENPDIDSFDIEEEPFILENFLNEHRISFKPNKMPFLLVDI